MNSLTERLRRQWGFAILSAFSLLALARLLLQKVPGHYRIFTGAGRALWRTQNPYGTDFGTGVGLYFYSPTCALTVFGPLALLPEKLGLVVYMAASWALFRWGVRLFWRGFGGTERRLQWFWALITAQMVGGILASKLEIAIAGLLLGSIALLKSSAPRLDRRALAAVLILAAILNWKFQPLPVVGLLVLARLLIWRDWKFPAALTAALGGWYLLPLAFFPRDFLVRIHQTWQSSFSAFVAESVFNFENLFAFAHAAFGASPGFAQTQLISGAAGLGLAAYLVLWTLRVEPGARPAGATLLAVTLGTVFMTSLSPLGQNNALILYAPLLLSALLSAEKSQSPRGWSFFLGFIGAVMILSYSDGVPLVLREGLRHLSVKPLACLALGLAVAWEMWNEVKKPLEKTT